jgi:hypothetical protein
MTNWGSEFGLGGGQPTPPSLPANRTIFPLGVYKLDETVDGLAGLKEFSTIEYDAMGRQFVGEVNYNAPPLMFIGRPWSLKLQTLGGRIRKIAPYVVLASEQEASQIAAKVLGYCRERLGLPAEHRTGLVSWNVSDGNVVLSTGNTDQGWCVSLFLTSSRITDYQRIGSQSSDARAASDGAFKIVYVTNIVTVAALIGFWVTGHLSWSVGAQVSILWLFVPLGIAWSRPNGCLSVWRMIMSLLGIGLLIVALGRIL